jgi:hypothetical protein
MLRRGRKLKPYVNLFFNQEQFTSTELESLTDAEWRQVDYLTELLQPFAKYTAVISVTNGPTVYQVLDVYNDLFNHFDK